MPTAEGVTYPLYLSQCNVWVYCGDAYGCNGCNAQTMNKGLGAPGQTFGPYGPNCYTKPGNTTAFPM